MIAEAIHYKELLDSHLIIDDWEAVDIILGMVASHKIPGEMLWLRLIGASATGKSEILSTISNQNGYCSKIESLTPASIRRGYISKEQKELPTMLARIDGKLVVTKELAPLLTANKELKLEVFGLLRSVHDGELIADYGSDQGHIEQHSHFDWMLGSTKYIDRQSSLEAQLGSRFIDLRWGAPLDRKKAITRAKANQDVLPKIRIELTEAMGAFIKALDTATLPDLNEDCITDLADFVATFRTPVERNRYNKDEIMDTPELELGTRVAQSFAKLAQGLSLFGITDCKPYMQRLAIDCLPPLRASFIKAVMAGHKTEVDRGKFMGVSSVTAHYVGNDLDLLGITNGHIDLLKRRIN